MIVLTLDVDWAPDFAIDFAAEIFIKADVRATWFITHASPALDRLREHPDLFELGIHPNFLPGSSHGDGHADVLDHCLGIVPEARSMRTHCLVQSNQILQMAMKSGRIEADGSIFLPYASGLEPAMYALDEGRIVRIPLFWEDDYEMEQPQPNWDMDDVIGKGTGLKVFDFHPLHLYMNTVDLEVYRTLVRRASPLNSATPEDTADLRREGEGPLTLFHDLVRRLSANGGGRTFRQIREGFLEGKLT